jgi:hypothetical protein
MVAEELLCRPGVEPTGTVCGLCSSDATICYFARARVNRDDSRPPNDADLVTGQPSSAHAAAGASGCGLTRRVGEYQTGLEINCRTRCQMIMLDALGTSLVRFAPSLGYASPARTAARPCETGAASRFARPAAGLAPCSPKRSPSTK